jgi:hypothetical protein
MRERERLEDFKGGAIACRVCHRLMYFNPERLMAGAERSRLCCDIGYMIERSRIDIVIVDRLGPEESEGFVIQAAPANAPILIEEDPPCPAAAESTAVRYGGALEIDAEEIESMVVTPATSDARKAERLTMLRQRR